MTGNPARWGPLLQESDLGSLGSLPYRNVSAVQEIQLVAQQIADSPLSATWSMLEDLLLVTQFPADLPAIDSARLVALCIKLMRIYTEKNKLFDHLYGLRCVQLLAVTLQVDLLRRRGLMDRAAPLMAKFGPQAVEFWLSDTASREASKFTFVSSTIHFQFWSADLEYDDRHFLLLTLWQARKELFHVSGRVPGIQGWVVMFAVIWLPLVHIPSQMEAVAYYRLKDLICRYVLAAKDDNTHPAAPTIVRWLHHSLKSQGYSDPLDPICIDPSDIEEMPTFRGALAARLRRSGKTRIDANIAATLLEFFVGYHMRSLEVSFISTGLRLLIESAYERLWLEIEDERCLLSMKYRTDTGDLIYAFLQTLSVLLLDPKKSRRASSANMVANPKVLADALHNVDWINLLGRIILLPTLPLNGRSLSVSEYEVIKKDWAPPNEIRTHCQIVSSYDQSAFLALSTSFSDWRKTHEFIQLQSAINQHNPIIKAHFAHTEKLWTLVGQTYGFQQVATYRCAYTGCWSLEVTHKINVKACSGCCRTYYCGQDCQMAHRSPESWNSHLWICCLEPPEALLHRG